MIRQLIVMGLLLTLSFLSACSGIGVSAALYRIDNRDSSENTHAMPLKCLFVECGEVTK